MSSIFLWAGVAIIIIGWLALSWQAMKAIRMREKMAKFKELNDRSRLRRNYCRITIIVGILFLLIALAIG